MTDDIEASTPSSVRPDPDLDSVEPESRWTQRRHSPCSCPAPHCSHGAEHLYWTGRYLERAEATARLVKVHTELYLDLPRSAGLGWAPLLAITGSREAFDDGATTERSRSDVVGFLIADAQPELGRGLARRRRARTCGSPAASSRATVGGRSTNLYRRAS